jgi:hypothetical protein
MTGMYYFFLPFGIFSGEKYGAKEREGRDKVISFYILIVYSA